MILKKLGRVIFNFGYYEKKCMNVTDARGWP